MLRGSGSAVDEESDRAVQVLHLVRDDSDECVECSRRSRDYVRMQDERSSLPRTSRMVETVPSLSELFRLMTECWSKSSG